MTTFVMQSKGTWASLTLAAAIASVCVGIAYDHDMLSPKAKPPLKASSVGDEGAIKIQLLADKINKNLLQLTTALEKYTPILCRDDAPAGLFAGNLFDLIAENLRYAERTLKSDEMSACYKTECKSILRALAKARSVASLNASIVSQRNTKADYYESDIDMDGLKALVAHSTNRLISSVS